MIIVTRLKDGITIEGYANYAEPGSDIVCSAVSALAQTLIDSIEHLTENKIEFKAEPGDIEIKYRDLSERGILLIDSFFVGVSGVEEALP